MRVIYKPFCPPILKIEDDVLKVEDDVLKVEDDVLKVEDDVLKIEDDVLKIEDDVLKIEDDVLKIEDDVSPIFANFKTPKLSMTAARWLVESPGGMEINNKHQPRLFAAQIE